MNIKKYYFPQLPVYKADLPTSTNVTTSTFADDIVKIEVISFFRILFPFSHLIFQKQFSITFLAQFFKKMRYSALYVRPSVSELASKRLEIETSDLLQKCSLENSRRAIEVLIFWTVSGPRAF